MIPESAYAPSVGVSAAPFLKIFRRHQGLTISGIMRIITHMDSRKITHCGFSDESSWNQGRYRSISLVTGPVDALKELEAALDKALNERDIPELKWNVLKGSSKIQAAIQVLHTTTNFAGGKECRIDTLVWDAYDTRHSVRGRDELQNLARMYYHLSRNVLRKKWPSDAVWMLLPDEHRDINWGALETCLDATARSYRAVHVPFNATPVLEYRREFNVHRIRPVHSSKYRLTQLADLFAGMAVFSRNEHSSFLLWESEQSGQKPLFGEAAECNASKTSQERFKVLQAFIKMCRQKRLFLDIKANGLETRAVSRPQPDQLLVIPTARRL